MHVNCCEKNSQNWIFHAQIKIGGFSAISAYFEKKVQEVEKNTAIKVYEDIFFQKNA